MRYSVDMMMDYTKIPLGKLSTLDLTAYGYYTVYARLDEVSFELERLYLGSARVDPAMTHEELEAIQRQCEFELRYKAFVAEDLDEHRYRGEL